MPQMAPISWVTLFTSFNFILMVCLTKIWFSKPVNTMLKKEILNKMSLASMMWKW